MSKLAILALIAMAHHGHADVGELTRLRAKVAVLTALESPRVQGRSRGVSAATICQYVDWCFDSAYLNPMAGDEVVAGCKLISAAYGESGFRAGRKNYNKNKTWDWGLMQVNSVHWTHPVEEPTWKQFCDLMGYGYGLEQLWNPQVNIEFAAVVNERLMHDRHRAYKYNNPKRPDQRWLWSRLQHEVINKEGK